VLGPHEVAVRRERSEGEDVDGGWHDRESTDDPSGHRTGIATLVIRAGRIPCGSRPDGVASAPGTRPGDAALCYARLVAEPSEGGRGPAERLSDRLVPCASGATAT
jgi:hypothetical protein